MNGTKIKWIIWFSIWTMGVDIRTYLHSRPSLKRNSVQLLVKALLSLFPFCLFAKCANSHFHSSRTFSLKCKSCARTSRDTMGQNVERQNQRTKIENRICSRELPSIFTFLSFFLRFVVCNCFFGLPFRIVLLFRVFMTFHLHFPFPHNLSIFLLVQADTHSVSVVISSVKRMWVCVCVRRQK